MVTMPAKHTIIPSISTKYKGSLNRQKANRDVQKELLWKMIIYSVNGIRERQMLNRRKTSVPMMQRNRRLHLSDEGNSAIGFCHVQHSSMAATTRIPILLKSW